MRKIFFAGILGLIISTLALSIAIGNQNTVFAATDQRLGGLNLSSYCKSLGAGLSTLSGQTWLCTGNNSKINLTSACVYKYKISNAFARQDIAGNPYSWTCYLPTAASPAPTASTTPKILFGMGSQAGPAMNFPIVKESPVHMLTSWYNGPSDLVWMKVQQTDLIPRLYANHYIVHLITWTDLPEKQITTPYGPACGRPYPVSKEVVTDMIKLAQIYNGPGPMYVSLFTEFPTFTCTDNNWIGNENYYKTLIDNYKLIEANFHKYAPQSKVGISFGGWLNRYDDQIHQGGRSFIPHFAEILNQSDFIAFQTMESDSNVADIVNMTQILHAYGKPIMLSHYKPSSESTSVFDNDMKGLFTDATIQKLTSNGLFAISFMDNEMLQKSPTSYNLVKNGIQKYGK